MCHVSSQIANYCNEEEKYCPVCGSSLTEESGNFENWLECDNKECTYAYDLIEQEEFEK